MTCRSHSDRFSSKPKIYRCPSNRFLLSRIITHRRPPTNCLVLFLLSLFISTAKSALTESHAMRIETFDTPDAASFCDARRFEVIEGTSGYLFSHKPFGVSTYRSGRDCFLALKAPAGYRIELTALEFQIDERYTPQTKKCAGDSLHIFDQDKPDSPSKKTRSHPGDQLNPPSNHDDRSISAYLSSNISNDHSPITANLCGKIANNTIIARSTMNILTLWWHSDPITVSPASGSTSMEARKGFKLQWTAFRDGAASGGCDAEKEFTCSSKICIPVELACDHVPHCTDKSDLSIERQRSIGCEHDSSMTASPTIDATTLIGISVGVVVFFGLIFIVISVCRRRNRNLRHQHKYNQAPISGPPTHSEHPHYASVFGDRSAVGVGATSAFLGPNLGCNSSNSSSNSENSNSKSCTSSSENSRNRAYLIQNQSQFANLYPIQNQNGIGFYCPPPAHQQQSQPSKLIYQHYHQHQHHPPQPPMAPPPSMVGGINPEYHDTRQSQGQSQGQYYYDYQTASDSRQPMIA